jgi:hypothetical protein
VLPLFIGSISPLVRVFLDISPKLIIPVVVVRFTSFGSIATTVCSTILLETARSRAEFFDVAALVDGGRNSRFVNRFRLEAARKRYRS